MKISQLKPYSLGIVAANKPLKSKIIEVTPIEDNPMSDGELTSDKEQVKSGSTDKDGAAYEVEMTASNSIKATWLPMGMSNRVTAPDVRRGEQVIIYRFADTDQYYWATLKDDLRLRKLETVIFAFSGTKDESKDCTPETTYFMEVSTHKKLIHIHTSKANGEPFGYDIQLNTMDGFLKIQDDADNSITLDSPEKQIVMVNGDGSFVNIDKKTIIMESTDLISLKSKVIKQESTDNIMKATTVTQDSTTSKLNASNFEVTASTKHVGNIALQGNITSTSGGGGTGKAEFAGDLNAKGSSKIDGTLTANKVVSTTPIDAPNV